MSNTQKDNNNYTAASSPSVLPMPGRPVAGRRAMILAAGLGTRLKPWTDKHPKALAAVNGKSLLQRNIEYLQRYGIYDVVVNVYHFAEQIIQAVDINSGWGSSITISDETGAVLETGGGLKKAAWYFAGVDYFLLMNVDVLTDMNLSRMINTHQQNKPLATLATTQRATSRYFLFGDNNTLCGWRNVKTGEEKIVRHEYHLVQKAFSGVHVISGRMLPLITQEGKFSMVDVYLSLAQKHIIQSFDHSSSRFIDVGKPESVTAAEKMF
ncbi:MAG TPA: sugar phosphate nucleotidyltransferase [Chitinophagaceae bacterium]|nr:sugar phosphate nucleotidyltransferase [Chitinophagaceae bacterium]